MKTGEGMEEVGTLAEGCRGAGGDFWDPGGEVGYRRRNVGHWIMDGGS